jgi:hypothetical protein
MAKNESPLLIAAVAKIAAAMGSPPVDTVVEDGEVRLSFQDYFMPGTVVVTCRMN